jgi:hypothetical protein
MIQFFFKLNLFLINFYCSRADFLKKVIFLLIRIFKGFDQFNREAVNIKKIAVINKYILTVKYF